MAATGFEDSKDVSMDAVASAAAPRATVDVDTRAAPARIASAPAVTFKLISQEGSVVEAPGKVAWHSDLIRDAYESDSAADEIALMSVSNDTLGAILEWATYHTEHEQGVIPKPLPGNKLDRTILSDFDLNFADRLFSGENLKTQLGCKVLLGAQYMQIQPLCELMLAKIATMCFAKMPDQIKSTFHITQTLTPQQEQVIRDNVRW